MRRNQLHCDVMVNIFKPTNNNNNNNNNTKKVKQPIIAPKTKKKYTTLTKPTNNDNNGLPSILNKSLKITDDNENSNDDDSDDINNNNTNEEDKIKNKTNNNSNDVSTPQMISFPVHRFILASRSSYFHSLLYGQVYEASNSTVLLPNDLFSSTILDIIIHYFYTDQLQIPQISTSTHSTLTFQKQIDGKKYSLKKLQKVYRAAEYLGHIDSLCNACLYQMEILCHQFKCTCQYCAVLLPSMLAFANKNQSSLPSLKKLRSTLLNLYTDPIQAMPPLWSQKTFALLILSHLDNEITTSEHGYFILPHSLQSLFYPSPNHSNISTNDDNILLTNNNHPPSSSSSSSPKNTSTSSIPSTSKSLSLESTLLVDLVSNTLAFITKHNAIHVLHSIHLCLSKIRSSDPIPTWSQPSLAIINAILYHTISMVSSNFDFYCVEYPILLSCVDGIGGAFSVDFLGFLLKRILNDGIQDSNAATLYQGIVRDLIGRQEVVKNVAVDDVLTDARQQCADYLSHRWIGVKAQGGFQSIDKDILKMLADDINVPYRSLSKPLESEFSAIFGFKPKSNKYKSTVMPDINITDYNGKSFKSSTVMSGLNELVDAKTKSKRRLSLGSMKYPKLSSSPPTKINTRASIDLVPTNDNNNDYSLNVTITSSSSSSSLENEERLSLSDNEAFTNVKHSHHRHLSLQPKRRYVLPRGTSTSSLTDVLLPTDASITSNIPSTTSSPNSKNDYQENENDSDQKNKNGDMNAANNNNNNNTSQSNNNNNNTMNEHSQSNISNNTNNNNNNDSSSSSPPPRRSRLTFELPETPIRAKYTTQIPSKSSKRSSKHKYRWSLGGSNNQSASESDEEDQILIPVIGAKVELLRRPLPTLGRIKYIGHVEFSKGTWVGVELESRLGQNDGSVDGIRYFQTDPQRGVFVKMDGLKLIAGPLKP
ncbi:unnamed protein product [Cunninghamella blakesleeana]